MALIDGPRDRLAALTVATDRALDLMHQGMTAEQASYVVSLELIVQRATEVAEQPVPEYVSGPVLDERMAAQYILTGKRPS
jgi:hypothetical protein